MELTKVKGKNLTDNEVSEINSAVFREWKIEPIAREKLAENLFFFLRDGNEILAMGGLKDVSPVYFDSLEFSILGFVEVIANIKGKGYGRKVVTSMRDYLIEKNVSGIGFTMPDNSPFYEKCGFEIELNSSQRFVYIDGDKRITDDEGQVMFYLDGKDRFMEKVLKKPEVEVIIPTDGLW